ncbi:uncharacterized protein LOC119345246 [Triticum dicoccoides]|uniref:uncharacterized protein LOC119345246 n=1 Tax=Triticum dicoccoides TaxID=85692 RepID=UPI00188E977A|nr:uncharacterized protein LOC119345246 [Triticum dicoccoides]
MKPAISLREGTACTPAGAGSPAAAPSIDRLQVSTRIGGDARVYLWRTRLGLVGEAWLTLRTKMWKVDKPSRPPIPFPLSIPSSTAAALLPPPRRGASRAPRGQRGSRARTSAAREVANTARRRARTSAVRSKCSSSQYGEAQRLHGLREVQGRKQPIRRAVPVRRPYGLRGVLDLAPTPPTRAGPPPGRRPHPHHQAPQRRPRLGVASEDFQGAAQGWRFWQLCSDDAVRAQLARFQHEEEDDLTGSSTTCLFCFSVASYSINTEHYARKSAAAIVQECTNSLNIVLFFCSKLFL